jgi:hypothetical protein
MPKLKALMVLTLAVLCAPAFGQNVNPASPGTLNYVEGHASLEGQALSSGSVGNTDMQPGQVIATANGKVEILLTPGIFLRLGDNSTLKMISTDLTHTEVSLERGRANVEVNQIYKQNTILVDFANGQTQLLKNGLYAFDANDSTVRVFDGKAAVYPGKDLQSNIKPIEVKGGRQLALNGEPVKPQRFDKDQARTDDLYKWSSLRSAYLGDANIDLASQYAGYGGFSPGWYWAGGPFGYTWLPGSGLYWSPFGYGYYSPYYIYGGGFVYRYPRGFYGPGRGYVYPGRGYVRPGSGYVRPGGHGPVARPPAGHGLGGGHAYPGGGRGGGAASPGGGASRGGGGHR